MKNAAKTAVLLGALGGLCVLIGSAWGPTGIVVGAAIGVGTAGFSYWFSDKLAIRSARAVEVTRDQMPQYHAIMEELSAASNMPTPRLYVSPEQQPNAFATGRNPHNAAVCVTEGLLRTLDWYEIRGVLAHELAHVRNRDILIGSVAAAVAIGITAIAAMARWALLLAGGRDGNNPFAVLLMAILAPVAAAVIQAALSRNREFAADESAARLLGSGEPLARALEKLESRAAVIPSQVNPTEASAYIVNPLRSGGMAKLFSTHPPAADRVARLRQPLR